MARREWADKLYEKAQRLKEPDDQFSRLPDYLVLRLLKAEHARAVRIVKREIRRGTVLGSLDNVLAALMKGRA